MNVLYKQLQSEYIAKMRSIAPDIKQWWFDHCLHHWTADIPLEEKNDFQRRWPAGPAGHPRIISLFRQYFFAASKLNDQLAGDGSTISFQRPVDLLVNDLATVAPDLFDILQGMVYVPIGVTLKGEEC